MNWIWQKPTFKRPQRGSSNPKAHSRLPEFSFRYAKITAPISGVIAAVSTQEGETVAASLSAPTFVTIIDPDRLEVWAYVDETDIGRIAVGQRATFTVDTYPETEFAGKVKAIFPKAVFQNNVVNYITTIEISETKGKVLRPEMTTTVTIILGQHDNALVVPNKAVTREHGQSIVYVLDDGHPEKRKVTLGWRNENDTEIISGLGEGEAVIVAELAKVQKLK